MKRKFLRAAAAFAVCAGLTLCAGASAAADSCLSDATNIKLRLAADNVYYDWESIPGAVQFLDNTGHFCFAYDNGKEVTVVKTDNEGNVLKKRISLKKTHPLFGTAICDSKGNFYLLTGENNTGKNTSKQTVFITKYDKNGSIIKTVGDDGGASLDYYYTDDYKTQKPFRYGNCSAAINGDLLTVNYPREMYTGHQSDAALTINTVTMTKILTPGIYNSHSMAQRVIPYKDGFVYASEGDCFDRAFSLHTYTGGAASERKDIFHFWIKKGAYDKFDLSLINNNFASMGGIAELADGLILFTGTSARSLSSAAANEPQDLFIQVLDPTGDPASAGTYITKGSRSGIGGKNGDEAVSDHGVKWLTNCASARSKVKEPQTAAIDGGRAVILFERYDKNSKGFYVYTGVYYCVVDSSGRVVVPSRRFSRTAHLDAYSMPLYADGTVYWAGNEQGDTTDTVYLYRLTIDD